MKCEIGNDTFDNDERAWPDCGHKHVLCIDCIVRYIENHGMECPICHKAITSVTNADGEEILDDASGSSSGDSEDDEPSGTDYDDSENEPTVAKKRKDGSSDEDDSFIENDENSSNSSDSYEPPVTKKQKGK